MVGEIAGGGGERGDAGGRRGGDRAAVRVEDAEKMSLEGGMEAHVHLGAAAGPAGCRFAESVCSQASSLLINPKSKYNKWAATEDPLENERRNGSVPLCKHDAKLSEPFDRSVVL